MIELALWLASVVFVAYSVLWVIGFIVAAFDEWGVDRYFDRHRH